MSWNLVWMPLPSLRVDLDLSKTCGPEEERSMKSFAIYGASDDLVVQEADGKPYEETGQPKSFTFHEGSKALHAKLSYNGKISAHDEEGKGA